MKNSKEDGTKPSLKKIKSRNEYIPRKRSRLHTCSTLGWGKEEAVFCSCDGEGIKECQQKYDEVKDGKAQRFIRERTKNR